MPDAFPDLFLDDDNLKIAGKLLPYLHPGIGQFLSVQIKLNAIRKIWKQNHYEESLHALNTEEASDIISILQSVRGEVSDQKARELDEVLRMLQFTQLYEQYQSVETPEPESPNKNNYHAAFSDPSVFSMLSQLMGGENQKQPVDMLNALLKANGYHSE